MAAASGSGTAAERPRFLPAHGDVGNRVVEVEVRPRSAVVSVRAAFWLSARSRDAGAATAGPWPWSASAAERTSRANRPATGRWRLRGKRRWGGPLTPATGGIEDADELAGGFAFQWIADDGGAAAGRRRRRDGAELNARGRGCGRGRADQGAGRGSPRTAARGRR